MCNKKAKTRYIELFSRRRRRHEKFGTKKNWCNPSRDDVMSTQTAKKKEAFNIFLAPKMPGKNQRFWGDCVEIHS